MFCNTNHHLFTCVQNPFSEIEYDDLQDHESSLGILLDMQDRQRYFEGQLGRAGSAGGQEDPRQVTDVQSAFRELLNSVNGWEGRFSQVSILLYTRIHLILTAVLVAENREKVWRRGIDVPDTERGCAARYSDEQRYACHFRFPISPCG